MPMSRSRVPTWVLARAFCSIAASSALVKDFAKASELTTLLSEIDDKVAMKSRLIVAGSKARGRRNSGENREI